MKRAGSCFFVLQVLHEVLWLNAKLCNREYVPGVANGDYTNAMISLAYWIPWSYIYGLWCFL